MVFPCEILPSLCSSLSTSNLSEILKNVHVFLIKTANSLLSSHPGLPKDNVWWIDSNSYSQEGMLANKNGALMHTFLYLSLLIIDCLICWPSDIPVGKHPNDNNIESNHQRSDIVEKHTSGDRHHYL